MPSVWVFAPVSIDGVHPSGFELLTKARSLSEDVCAVALGPGAMASAEALGRYGARRLFASDDAVFAEHGAAPAAEALTSLVAEHLPSLVLFPTTYDGRDVAGRLQAKLGSTLMSNATDVLAFDRARTEIFGGTKVVDVELSGAEPRLVLVRPRSFPAEPLDAPVSPDVIEVPADVPAEAKSIRVLARMESSEAGVKLEDARVVIAGGRGLGGPEAFSMLDELASAIGNAAVGATRAAVDAGWVPYSYQIGQTGRTVTPEVYLAIGVSGALQHVVGMKGATRIVAINRDAEAPILAMSDLGVTGDLFQIVPALTQEILRRRSG
ncbi:MAG: electron transfer flavoprotein subunit alpha/FixB family protein [Actinomycetota bacterium]